MSDERISLEVRSAAEPVAEAGWYLAYGYGIKPLVVYASRGMRVWRDGMRQIPITWYAGPLPEQR